MSKVKRKKRVPIEEIEEKAIRGDDVSAHFSGKAKRVAGSRVVERVLRTDVQRVNVDFAQEMLEELDGICYELNVPRQSLIKTLLRQAMDGYFSAKKLR